MNVDLIIIIITLIVGFYMAWNIGANDVSNALGTSVGSKALTLKKAIIIASILEFSGAFFLGSHVSSTIQKGIINPQFFSFDPTVFALGMMGTLLATGIWLNLASYFKLPISTTHAIIGALIGFGAFAGGIHAIHWDKVYFITISWIISPFIAGFLAYFLFLLLQKKVLYALNPFDACKKLVPFLTFFSITFFSLNFLFKGFYIHLPFLYSVIISIGLGSIASLLTIILLKRFKLVSSIPKYRNLPQQVVHLEKALKHLQRTKLSSYGDTYDKTNSLLKELRKLKNDIKNKAKFSETTTQYTHIEKIFAYLQIMSLCLVAFAHGANDVANAIGPISAVINSVKTHAINFDFNASTSILLLGGIGIVIGLATWGWRVVETIGKKITELTPTRGFSAELGAAITILLASKLGLPISTTHVLVGAVLGVGVARGLNALNLKTIRDIILSWFVTIPVCAILSIFIFYILKIIFL